MGFDDAALTRLRRYREEADKSLQTRRGIEETARRFAERLFTGLEHVASLGREAGFGVEVERTRDLLVLKAEAAPGEGNQRITFARVPGTAAETDEDLMHERLSSHILDPSGYSARILGWSEDFGDGPCQTFAVYAYGAWKTKGMFVAKARGRVDDADEILSGFCLRILGRVLDSAALTGGAGRRWGVGPYTLPDLLSGGEHPTELRPSR